MIFTIAVDGPAAAGKGTIARALAGHFGFAYLDTGLMYRAIAARVREGADAVQAARELTDADLARSDLRHAETTRVAAEVAACAKVREGLVARQRTFARRPGGAVLDGRDIGTVICPQAEVKLFVTADLEERAKRRQRQFGGQNLAANLAEICAQLAARDKHDRERNVSPLRPADDAVEIDTTGLTIEQAIQRAIEIARKGRATPAKPVANA